MAKSGENEIEKEREFYTLQEAVEILKVSSSDPQPILRALLTIHLLTLYSQAVEVARPFSSFEVHIVTSISSHQSNALRGRLTLPLSTSRRPPSLIIFAADGTPASASAKAYASSHPTIPIQVGGTELIQAVVDGSAGNFDKVLASPEMMPALSRALARSLGPKGLMPNAKRGTVAEGEEEMAEAIGEAVGAVDWRGDKQAVVRAAVARTSFSLPEVRTNLRAFMASVLDRATSSTLSGGNSTSGNASSASRSSTGRSRWSTLAARGDGERAPPDAVKKAKGVVKQVHISSTMGPGIKLPVEEVI